MKTSIIIPARHELYLAKTVDNILRSAAGDIEIIVVLDGYWPVPILQDHPRLIIVHRSRHGMRSSINDAVSIARGEWIMKIDAHCMVSDGFDEVLLNDIDKDWIVVPRRYSLDADTWQVKNHKPWTDYEYLAWPYSTKFIKSGRHGMHAMSWDERTSSRINLLFDEQMTFQGSCWVMSKEHFVKRIGGMKPELYGQFPGEAQELGMTTWLSGGRVMLNKRAWYAHLWKGHGYSEKCREVFGQPHTRQGSNEAKLGNQYVIDYWLHNTKKPYKKDIDWLVERFWPVPGWPKEPEKWRVNPNAHN